MENAVIGVFDNYSHARDAADAMLAVGFREWAVQITPKEDSWAARRAAMEERTRHSSPGSWSIGEFFRSLFGTDADHEHAHIYSEAMRRGSFLLTVEADDDHQLQQARDLLGQFHPIDIEERAAHWRSHGWSAYDSHQEPYTDEEIRAERAGIPGLASDSLRQRATSASAVRSVPPAAAAGDAGRAVAGHPTKKIQQSDTTAAGGDSLLGGGDSLLGEDDLDLPGRSPVSGGGGSAHSAHSAAKAGTSLPGPGTSGTMSNAAMRDSTAPDIYTLDRDTDYRTHWQKSAGVSEGRYEDFAPAYRFGADLRQHEVLRRYHSWNDVEPEARREWESRNSNSGSAWENARDAVRYGWEKPKE